MLSNYKTERMPKDNKSGSSSSKKRYNLRDRKSLNKKKNESSDSSDNSDYSESESDIDMNNDEYQKFLSKMFPSNSTLRTLIKYTDAEVLAVIRENMEKRKYI